MSDAELIALITARKAELSEAKEKLWAELNQVMGAITFCDGLLAELQERKDGNGGFDFAGR